MAVDESGKSWVRTEGESSEQRCADLSKDVLLKEQTLSKEERAPGWTAGVKDRIF